MDRLHSNISTGRDPPLKNISVTDSGITNGNALTIQLRRLLLHSLRLRARLPAYAFVLVLVLVLREARQP